MPRPTAHPPPSFCALSQNPCAVQGCHPYDDVPPPQTAKSKAPAEAGALFSALFLYPAPVCGEYFRTLRYNSIILQNGEKSIGILKSLYEQGNIRGEI